MSTDTKDQVMGELLGIHAAAIEKAKEQAGRIIEMVKGEAWGICKPVYVGSDGETGDYVALSKPEEPPASVKVQPTEFKEATDEHILEDLDNHKPVSYDYLKLKGCTEFTPADLSYLKDRGHTWAEIGAEAGISPEAARKRVEKWRAKQKQFCGIPKGEPKNDIEPIPPEEDLPPLKALIKKIEPVLYEPGADEARREADLAEATIRKSLTVEEFIQERIAAGDLDIEILQAVKRNFPGVSMNVADIRSRRQVV